MPYVVSKYVDGEDLHRRLSRSGLTIRETAGLIATLAETLNFVHDRGVVHRDIKPGNVLLDARGTPFLTDFGLALRDVEFGTGSAWAGTPVYMSPEQARGESHRVDGRSDVFSLGVLLYELLTGSRPFMSDDVSELVDQIARAEPRSLRQINRSVPKELERICFKALAKRAADRFPSAGAFADDLRSFLEQYVSLHESSVAAPSSTAPASAASSRKLTGIVPRGLRSYEEDDSHFFHALLPGPRDRHGLPDSIAFWKSRIEETDPQQGLRIGLVYGPSGCGKSSFVKAGLLPVLSDNVHTVFVEASPGQTEARLLNALQSKCPRLPDDIDLPRAMSRLRRGRVLAAGRKLLIVIDQFEQWLHTEPDQAHSILAAALRQCDGQHVQCMLLVRDDFWLAVSRFMDDLEVELVQNHNMALVDLFDKLHARKVLAELGKGYGRLPGHLDEFDDAQERFLTDAVAGLARDERIVPVRLALFAEMVKSRDWKPATLRKLGGIAGVGVMFFEEMFGPGAPAEHRVHRDAVRKALGSLLPEAGTNIKGHMRSHEELAAAAGYDSRSKDFSRLLAILDAELRLITPTDPLGDSEVESSRSGDVSERYYQLTHDYLVPAIRDWITRRQKQTARGRAELALSERAELWDRKREARNLPSWLEWVRVLALTRRRLWTSAQRDMMSVATRRYSAWSAVAVLSIFAAVVGGWWLRGKARTDVLIAQLQTADDADLPEIVAELRQRRRWSQRRLESLQQEQSDPRTQLRASVALLEWNSELIDGVTAELLTDRVSPVTLRTVAPFLQPFKESVRDACWQGLRQTKGPAAFHAALLLGAVDPPDADTAKWSEYSGALVARLIQESADNRQYHAALVDLARPLRPVIVPLLHRVLVSEDESDLRRNSAAALLRDVLVDRPQELAAAFLDARVADIRKILPILDRHQQDLADYLNSAIDESAPAQATPAQRDVLARRGATAAALLARHGRFDRAPPLLKLNSDPAPRVYLVLRLSQLGVRAESLLAELEQQTDASIRAALVQALGRYPRAELAAATVESALEQFQRDFSNRRYPELHSSAQWALMRFGAGKWVAEQYRNMPRETQSTEVHRWYVNPAGHVMVRVVPNASAGLPPFEVAVHETTVQQFLEFRPGHNYKTEHCPTDDCPIGGVTWFAAVDYCRWLTEREQLDEKQMAFEKSADKDTVLADDYRNRRGYRLLTHAEWAWLVHCGAQSPYFLGWNTRLIEHYDAVEENSADRCWPAGTHCPNPAGLFGLYANLGEWCADGRDDSRVIFTNSYRTAQRDVKGILEFNKSTPTLYWYSMGFRVARSIPQDAAEK